MHPGLTYVGEDLFAALAEAVPALSTLTLVLRQDPHQDDRKPSGWPGTTYQYAPYLAAFPRLTTFAWNYKLMPLCGTFPSDLRIYEDQCSATSSVDDADDSTWDRLPHSGKRDGITLCGDDWERVARLFLVHIPTLRSFPLLSGVSLDVEYCTTTDAAGKIAVKVVRGMKYYDHISRHFPSYCLRPRPPLVLARGP